jgi:hypothetical protein
MRQEINLYQSVFRPKRDPLRSRNLLLCLAALLLVLGSLWWLQGTRLASLERRVEASDQRRRQLKQQVRQLEAEHPEPTVSSRLKQRATALRQARQDRILLLERLKDRLPEAEQGFSAYLGGLARQRVEGVWLRSITIDLSETEYLLLEGRSEKAELIPRYLQRLSREEPFQGIAFDSMRLQRLEEHPEVLGFRLTTHSGGRP